MSIQRVIVAATAAVSFAFGAGAATDLVWTGNGDGVNWSKPANWDGNNTPGSGYVLVFQSSVTVNNDMGAVTVEGIRTENAPTVTITGEGKLTLGTSLVENTGTIYFRLPVDGSKIGWSHYLNLGASGCCMYFCKGFTCTDFVTAGSGAVYFQDVPCTLASGCAQVNGGSEIHFDVAGNVAQGGFSSWWNNKFYFSVADAYVGIFGLGNVGASSQPTVYLGADQTRITKLWSVTKTAATAPLITSTEKAKIVLSGAEQGSPSLAVRLQGKAGIEWNPDDEGTLAFEANAQPTAGDLIVSKGTIELKSGSSFTALSLLKVAAGATFTVDAGGGANFHADELQITAGATLNLAPGVALSFGTAKLVDEAGALIKYLDVNDYSSSTEGVTIAGGGKITVQSKPTVHTTARWDAGGGAATGLTTASNWEGDETPDLTSGGLTATFDAGSAAMVDVPTMLEGISITANTTDFTFAKSGGNGISVLSNGITVAAGASARTVVFDAPLAARQPQTWTVSGAQDTLAVAGGLAGPASAPVSFVGKGKLKISGKTDYAGQLVFMPTSASTLSFENSDFAGTMHIGNPTATSGIGNTITVTGENVFRGHVNFRDRVTINNGGRLVFAGGILPQFDITAHGGGTYVITNTPFVHTSIRQWFSDTANKTEVWAAGNVVNFVHYNASRLDCCVPGVLRQDCNLMLGVSAFDMNRGGILYMTGDQYLKNFITYPTMPKSASGQPVHALTPSVLVVKPNEDRDCYASFHEAASFKLNAAFTYTFHYPSSSTGTVEVAAGKVVFADKSSRAFHCEVQKKDVMIDLPGGSWVTASKVSVGGGSVAATLELTHGKTFGKQTVLDVRTNGKVQLDGGVRERVGELWLGGVKVSSGLWGSSASGAPNVDDTYFVGEGQVQVGKPGLIFVFR